MATKLYFIVRQAAHESSMGTIIGLYNDEQYADADILDRNSSDPATSGQYLKFVVLKEEAIPDYHKLSLNPDNTNASAVSVSGIATLEAAKHEPSGAARHSYVEWNLIAPIQASGLELDLHGMITAPASGFTRVKVDINDYELYSHIKDAVHYTKTFDSQVPGISQPHTIYNMSTTIACDLAVEDSFTLRFTRLDDEDSMPESVYFISATYRFLAV